MRGVSKDIGQLVKALEAQGFTVEHTKGNHLRVRNPAGAVVATMPGTSVHGRGMLNTIATLRRAGYVHKGR